MLVAPTPVPQLNDEDGVMVDPKPVQQDLAKPKRPTTTKVTVDPDAATRFLNPTGAYRKKKVLAARAHAGPGAMKVMQMVKNKGSTKATMKNMGSAQADAKRSKQADAKRKQLVIETWRMPLTNGSISGPTSEANPRCELVAYYGQPEGRKTKLHIWTSTVRSWGQSLLKDMQDINELINVNNVTKEEALSARKKKFGK